MKLRRVTQSYAEFKTLRSSIISWFSGIIMQVTQSSCTCMRMRTRAYTCARVLHNMRNTRPVRILYALIPSVLPLLTILSFSCVTKLKKEKTDSNCSKKEALLLGVCL